MKTLSETGFAGLQTLVSDVEPALREAERRKGERTNTRASSPPSSAPSTGERVTPVAADNQPRSVPQKSLRWGRVVAAVGVMGLIILINQESEPRSQSTSSYYSGTPATPPAPSAAAPSTSNGRTPGLAQLTFTGRATNRGYPSAPAEPTSATIALTVPERDASSGYLSIDPPLGGAGNASFHRWADSVLILSVSASGDTIAWLGRAVRGGFSGSYRIVGGQWMGQWGDWFLEQTGGLPVGTLSQTNRPFPDSVDVASLIGETANKLTSAPDGLYERPPMAGGGDRVLDIPEIRYCLAEQIRLEAAAPIVDETSQREIERYNEFVASYNVLCGQYRYRSGTLEAARRDVERHRARFVREGRARLARSSGQRSRPAGVGYGEAQGTTSAAARTSEPNVTPREVPNGRPRVAEERARSVQSADASRTPPNASVSSDPQNLATCLSGNYPTLCKRELLSEDQRSLAQEAERKANYRTCASGQYPSLCRYELLTRAELQEVRDAERAANYRTCASGQYPSLCKHHLLTPEQLAEVRAAESAANYRACASGQYPSLCKHALLTPEQLEEVRDAERRVNLRTCMTGLYPSLCKRSLLSSDEAVLVDAAERRNRRP